MILLCAQNFSPPRPRVKRNSPKRVAVAPPPPGGWLRRLRRSAPPQRSLRPPRQLPDRRLSQPAAYRQPQWPPHYPPLPLHWMLGVACSRLDVVPRFLCLKAECAPLAANASPERARPRAQPRLTPGCSRTLPAARKSVFAILQLQSSILAFAVSSGPDAVSPAIGSAPDCVSSVGAKSLGSYLKKVYQLVFPR